MGKMLLLPSHSTRFLLINQESIPLRNFYLQILVKPLGRKPGKAVYATRGDLIDISFQYGSDNTLKCWMTSSPMSRARHGFNLVPILVDGLLDGFRMEYSDGTVISFEREPEYYNSEIQEAVPEGRIPQ